MAKHLMSPEGGENALPKPKHEKIGGHHGSAKPIKSPKDAPMGDNHMSPTPDMKGRLFDHMPNKHGV